MDWITLLRSLQSDFIKRLTSGCLLHCETEGQYSELTIISGERLKALRDFCWLMAEKYKRTSPVRDVFISNLKGKLGEEVVKERLANLITEVDYEKRFGGDGKIDFTLTADPAIGVEVKSRHGTIDKVRWSVSSEEVEKNAVIVCVLIQEEVHEAQSEYHLFLAGFLPTQMIKLKRGRIAFGINQLLYGGGLYAYLEQLQGEQPIQQPATNNNYHPPQVTAINQNNHQLTKLFTYPKKEEVFLEQEPDLNLIYVNLGDKSFEQGESDKAIINYNQALELDPENAEVYYKRGMVRYHLGDYEGAIADYTQVIQINLNHPKAYQQRGLARYQLGDYHSAIDDYTQAIRINPHVAVTYRNRGDARSHLGDRQGAIEDYSQAIKINPHYAVTDKNSSISRYLLIEQQKFTQAIKINSNDALAYYNRAQARADLGDYEGTIADYTQAIKINPNYVDAYYSRGNAHFDLGDYHNAMKDYTQVIKLNSHYVDAYYNRGHARFGIGDKQGALEDFRKAADIYWKEGKIAEHNEAREKILDLEIEESLDILNF
ncbi:tetratricopeptide repeat protein [Calothrix anomala FACHB-343]|uniref:Tetratricopeptide repeat protein n=2 Tax=Calothrix TaxID=1186 RepID=A0ABR8AJX3_9CYAN|nr:tetratricopeptide repeat protein [Calothrix parietina FACHB-288]MBD2225571.1 tetratricopeptide repeat protein [Calothrix anomala FACHB-343]